MKNNRLYESFAKDLRMARSIRRNSQDILPNQRRERSNDQYLQAHNGEWFSFYDLGAEKNQCWTPITDIIFTFNYVYGKYAEGENYTTRIFIERCTNSDISHIEKEIESYFRHKKYEFNIYTVHMNNAEDNFTDIRSEIQNNDIPAIVFVDADNHTYDDIVNASLSEEEIGDVIDRLTDEILPASGVLVYMERYPKYDGDDFDIPNPYDYDETDAEPDAGKDYPEGYGTMEIDFDE